MTNLRSASDVELEKAYADAYGLASGYQTASHVMAAGLELDLGEIRSLLKEAGVQPLGRDKTCWGKICATRSANMAQRRLASQEEVWSTEGAHAKLCACSPICLQPVSFGCDYVHGHHMRDPKHLVNSEAFLKQKSSNTTASKLLSGYHHSEDTKQLISANNKSHLPEVREKNRQAHLELYKDPAYYQKVLDGVHASIAAGTHGICYRNQPTGGELLIIGALDSSRFEHVGQKSLSQYGGPISIDIVHKYLKLAIMHDGCYWHECPEHGSGTKLWMPSHDAKQTKKAEDAGWVVLRFWEHEVFADIEAVIEKVMRVAETLQNKKASS